MRASGEDRAAQARLIVRVVVSGSIHASKCGFDRLELIIQEARKVIIWNLAA